jgi:hypothetical protein
MIIEGYSGIVGTVKAGQVKLIAVAKRPTQLQQLSGLNEFRLLSRLDMAIRASSLHLTMN